MTPDVTSPRVTLLSLTSTRYRHYMNTLHHSIIQLAHIPSLSQAASRVEESSDDLSQEATAAVPHSVETTVISELVVTSTLLLPGDIENIINCHTHPSKGSFTTIEQSTYNEVTKGPVVGKTSFPAPTSTQGIEYKTTGMWLLY